MTDEFKIFGPEYEQLLSTDLANYLKHSCNSWIRFPFNYPVRKFSPGNPSNKFIVPGSGKPYFGSMKIAFLLALCLVCSRFLEAQSSTPPLLHCDSIAAAFSPNEDGINDRLELAPVFTGYEKGDSLSWRIFNRWGEEVFRAAEPGAAWNGKDKKGKICAAGMYPYLLTVTDRFGTRHQCKGTITLIR